MDVFNLEYVAQTAISPDGQWVVYVRQFFDVMTDRRYSNLWLVRSDGTDHRPLTTGKYNDYDAVWSPDGKRLAYISTREGAPQIYVRWMDNGQTYPITRLQEPPSGLAWSPDGSQIAFFKLVPEAPLVIGQQPPP
ncbi:MAG: PD40 domain-containing protein, partial [Gemmatimonadetes bacterium]|nr:PD40 domain-containing protein [Gemmatimonadota bacterium]